MWQFAVCDDEEKYLKQIKTIISEYGEQSGEQVSVSTFTDGRQLLNEKNTYDMIFLDIEMGAVNGIDIAEQIREYDVRVPIVYVTHYEEFWKKAYRVHPFHFLSKPVDRKEIFDVISDMVKLVEASREKRILLATENGAVSALADDIQFFMINDKKQVVVCMNEQQHIVRGTMTEIYETLDKNVFYMPHRSYIINLDNVNRLENNFDIIMDNGEFCLLAQKKKKEFMNKMYERNLVLLKGRKL